MALNIDSNLPSLSLSPLKASENRKTMKNDVGGEGTIERPQIREPVAAQRH
jgi:hypothetical protein